MSKMEIFFSYIGKPATLKDCDRGEDNILSDGSRPTRPVIELETRRASINKPRPWSSMEQHKHIGENLPHIF